MDCCMQHALLQLHRQEHHNRQALHRRYQQLQESPWQMPVLPL
jgi:hypothetical protein